MAYKHKGYTLYRVKMKNSDNYMYFFAKNKPKSGKPCDKPADRIVKTNKRTGLPYLKKK